MFISRLIGLAAVAGIATAAAAAADNSSSLPIVDLGYELHQASSFNDTGNFYNFSNIRYAAPPVRFAAPVVPVTNRSSVQTGEFGKICPQASPAWSSLASQLLTDIILGVPDNNTTPYTPPAVNASATAAIRANLDPAQSEDCLFLDVFVPENILKSAGSGNGSAVLVWIYGGGYTAGNKANNPAGLLAASGNVSDGEVIYVAMNYRLGAFGWSSGPSYQAEGGVSNLGLLDQRMALDWVQEHITQFGGDPNRVTVFGESAGGGSIMHQITAYGGLKGPAPFQQAIPQSPGWLQVSSNLQQEDTYNRLLNLTNTTSLAQLQALPTEDLMTANIVQVLQAQYGGFAYGPAVDGGFVPAQPGQLLARGQFDKDVHIMVGHNAQEGTYFTPSYINSTSDILMLLRANFPYSPEPSLEYITSTLYPAVFDGTLPYTTEMARADLIISESVFTCNTRYLSTAYGNQSYSYLFAVPPAFHGFDVAYTYYDDGAVSTTNPLEVTNRTVAIALQEFITSFAENGVPEAQGIMKFQIYGPDAQVLDLNITGIEEVRDSNANARCDWWQKGLLS
ncbi:carboxylesterase family protein-like protein [Pleomassaria siparia CBS 279.74]|uniref:Carboxylic ester hydrolase n=1 Tax=Pleomassaria siparia CBS 279.74 TaxID=1314801 RepID=A0A6G1JUN9_9PLEO|nr:carboxylesterase family protein-like protein [Pleomassaria siparia CBS 279.74]